MSNLSNIVFNTETRQFASCAYVNGILIKTVGAGTWEDHETKFLTIEQARALLTTEISWNSPSSIDIQLIFNPTLFDECDATESDIY